MHALLFSNSFPVYRTDSRLVIQIYIQLQENSPLIKFPWKFLLFKNYTNVILIQKQDIVHFDWKANRKVLAIEFERAIF